MPDIEKQMEDTAKNIIKLADEDKVDETRQEIEKARNLIIDCYNESQVPVPQTR
jgi:type III secretory pathway component EscU